MDQSAIDIGSAAVARPEAPPFSDNPEPIRHPSQRGQISRQSRRAERLALLGESGGQSPAALREPEDASMVCPRVSRSGGGIDGGETRRFSDFSLPPFFSRPRG
jgi:hypothetical protein